MIAMIAGLAEQQQARSARRAAGQSMTEASGCCGPVGPDEGFAGPASRPVTLGCKEFTDMLL
jgi:hypothetical protein